MNKNIRINTFKYPYSADKVKKRNVVGKRIYLILITLSIAIIVLSLFLKNLTKTPDVQLILDVFTNLGYGIFGSTVVALLIEIRDVRFRNKSFTSNYVLTIKSFLKSYIEMMAFYREYVVESDKSYEYKDFQWIEWTNKAIEMQKKLAKTDNSKLEEKIRDVRKEINLIFQAGPSGVLNALDEVSYSRLYMIDKDLKMILEKRPSDFNEYLKKIIIEECDSWFLLKGLSEERFGAEIEFLPNCISKRMYSLFEIDI